MNDFANPDSVDAFSIECEVGIWDVKTLPFYDFLYYKDESSNIYEPRNMHELDTDDRIEYINVVNDIYADCFPNGVNHRISGGTHLHIFGINTNIPDDYSFFLSCPLWCKIGKNKLHSRPFGATSGTNCCVQNRNELRTSYGPSRVSTEFRLNNVTDPRILGYYQAIILAFNNNVKSEGIVFNNKYEPEDNIYRTVRRNVGLVELNGFCLDISHRKTIRKNLNILCNLLVEHNFSNSCIQLLEYLNERGFKIGEKNNNLLKTLKGTK